MLLLILLGLVFSDFMIILHGEPSLLIVTNGPGFHALASSSVTVSEGSSFSLLCMVMENGNAAYGQVTWVKNIGQLRYDVAATTDGLLNFVDMTVDDTGEYSCLSSRHKLMRIVYITVAESEVSNPSTSIKKRDIGAYDSLADYPPFDGKVDYDKTTDGDGGNKVNQLEYNTNQGKEAYISIVELATEPLKDPDQKHFNEVADTHPSGSLDEIGPPLTFSIGIMVVGVIMTTCFMYKMFFNQSDPCCSSDRQSNRGQQIELDELGPSRAGTPLQQNGLDLPPTYSSLICNELPDCELPPPYSSTLGSDFFTQRNFSDGLNAAPPPYSSTVSVPAESSPEEQPVVEVPQRPLSMPHPSVPYSLTPASSCTASSNYGKSPIGDSTSNDSVSNDE